MGSAADPVNVRFALTNRAENVRLVRELLAGIGSAVRLGDAALDDAMIAVSEASNNAVMHAYGGAEGPLELDLGAGPRIVISPSGLVNPILSRLATAVGAQAGFTLDRLSDTQLVIDALTGSGAPYMSGGGVVAALTNARRRLELRIGPLSSRGVEAVSGGPPYGSLGLIMAKLTECYEHQR